MQGVLFGHFKFKPMKTTKTGYSTNALTLERLQEQLRRERQRCTDDRAHYENEANQIRRISTERAQAEIDRIREEEEAKRKVLMKKHAVNHPLFSA